MALEAANAAGVYTEKILNDNFTNIAKALKAADNRMDMLENGIRHVSGHVGELFQFAEESTAALEKVSAAVKAPSRIKPFVVGVVAGVVVYKYVTRNRHKIDVIMENVNEGAKQRFQDVRESVQENIADSKTPPSA